ncbi:MAG: 3-oxoacyl-ACP reductase [Gammaproteobacteria bacterium]|nr:3-oxoacyl-ACP reductase [Gammaproteobacteria bacterium]|tara:strand:- start:76446 stop:77186 length:741 start_codon:yes stop_codon:yes gene_type:complete
MSKKVAVVSGASRGIGKAIALKLGLQNQYIVLGTATTESGAEKISAYLSEAGIEGKGYCLNVTDTDSIQTFCKAITEEYNAPEILVNNAGITRDNIIMRMKEEEWQDVINTNLNAIFRISKALVRGMTKARWGRIISISSVVGSSGNMGQSNYAASKAGIEGFSRALALEVGSRGITVNCVAPGFIDTDMTREISAEHSELLLGRIPLGRYGQPEEVAAAVAYLASDEAGYITGETLHVNGGMYMG